MIRAWRIKEWFRTTRKLAVLLAVFCLVGAACAGDESTSAEEGVAETEASDSNTDGADDGAADDGAADDGAADDGAADDGAADDGAADDGAADDGAADDGAADDGAADGEAGNDAGTELPNACPAEGCEVVITDAEASPSGELQLTFDANYTPDFEQNHIHVFWDTQEPGAVSSDYEAKGYDVQGKWHPTDEYPVYETQADASVGSASRGSSTTICVTAADTDHAVIDATIYDCKDVAELLGS